MVKTEPWFLGERAEALAALYLTRHKELEVIPVSRHALHGGYDLLVTIRQGNDGRGGSFGVETKGILASQLGGRGTGHDIFPVTHTSREVTANQLPVCVFVFTVNTEVGYYRWLHKPVVYPYGGVGLETDDHLLRSNLDRLSQATTATTFETLTDAAIDQIVRIVSSWYEIKDKLVS